jgi:hypothetical protein
VVDGGVRAAKWIGEDGEIGELVLDAHKVGELAKAEDLRSIRDKNFDAIKLQLSSWLATAKCVPDWLIEATKTLRQWRSQTRLAAVAIRWRSERFDGDCIFQVVEDWRKQDKHLYEWEANARRGFLAWRQDRYRVFADQLGRKYGRLLIAAINWKSIQDKPAEEEADELRVARKRKRLVSPSQLQAILVERFGEVTKAEAKHLSGRCNVCGEMTEEPDRSALYYTCRHCESTYDQDENHCLNLLASSKVQLVENCEI